MQDPRKPTNVSISEVTQAGMRWAIQTNDTANARAAEEKAAQEAAKAAEKEEKKAGKRRSKKEDD